MRGDSKKIVPAIGELPVYVGDDGVSKVHVCIAQGTVWVTQTSPKGHDAR